VSYVRNPALVDKLMSDADAIAGVRRQAAKAASSEVEVLVFMYVFLRKGRDSWF
jgi:hypothetical protein